MDELLRNEPYGSAADLPSFMELAEQVRNYKLITTLIGRKHRAKIIEIERQLTEMIATVDRFYDLLGNRNWIFHDNLNIKQIQSVLTSSPTPDAVERQLIDQYQERTSMDSMVRKLNAIPELRVRQHQIQQAVEDYRAERYYASTLVLLIVMDGFVNDVESKRHGLHRRSPEDLVAWDSVVGHHKGLSHAHRSFIKSTGKTRNDEVFELYRHGILHGTILHFDNVIVATKAWNRLFAVADWAHSIRRRAEPKTPEPTLKEVMQNMLAVKQDKEALDAWRPYSLSASDKLFSQTPAYDAVKQFLAAWQHRNYGRLSQFIPDQLITIKPAAKPARAREAFEGNVLTGYRIDLLDFVAAAVCEVTVHIDIDGVTHQALLRWVRENPGTSDPAIREEDGEWRLYTWTPQAMISRVESSKP